MFPKETMGSLACGESRGAYWVRPTGGGPMANNGRRNFLRKTAALTGGALAGSAGAAPLPVPPTAQEAGRPIEATAYGVPSKYESHVLRRRSDVLRNRQNL